MHKTKLYTVVKRKSKLGRICNISYINFFGGWPKKVNHYQESSLNRTKTATFFINFEYKMSTRML